MATAWWIAAIKLLQVFVGIYVWCNIAHWAQAQAQAQAQEEEEEEEEEEELVSTRRVKHVIYSIGFLSILAFNVLCQIQTAD